MQFGSQLKVSGKSAEEYVAAAFSLGVGLGVLAN